MTDKLGMIIDHEACWGCDTCEIACKQENNPPEGSRWIHVRTEGVQKINGKLKLTYAPAYCLQCSRPPCKEACPFGVMQFNSEKGVAEKCHLCYHRIDRGEKPACVDKCIGRCIYFGTIEELLAKMAEKK